VTELRQKIGTGQRSLDLGDIRARLTKCGLTPRQQQVVELAMRGLSNRQISAELRIEEQTVKAHLRDIFYRLKIQRRTSLMLKILQLTKTI
jgi:DNA-binding NarL/FixJ family response regulator